MTPEERQELKKLSDENSSTQNMLSEIRTMLSEFIKDEREKRRDRAKRHYVEVGYRG
jgi:hypothetical protein